MAKAIETLSIKLEFKAGSGSQQIIDKIGKSIKDLKVTAGQTAPSIEKVRKSINDFAKQGNRSISTIDGQVTALRALRREADINSKEFKELTADIARYERQLNKAQGRQGKGGRLQGIAQGVGAIAAGAVFGGPEGALGGAAGLAVGGPAGAAVGAAIGAQVGGIRKAIGAAADYSAQIQKLEIGLRGVVSSESQFQQAIAAANSATKDFNISAIDSITGITRLSAAVIGAGGNLTDVEIVFRGISSAVLATGGSADDVRSAITAMVQVFSKGKVSAEELSGQLGERLPGAVVRFAKAAFGTGPAAMQKLQKELKAGTVGLNELMLFAKDSGLEFEELAKKIAKSSASAGARLNILVDAFRLELGTSIQPVGAQIQDFAGEVLVEFKDEIIAVVKELGKLVLGLLALAKFVGDNKEIIGFFAGLALKIKAAQLALAAFAGIKTAFAGVVAAGTTAKITGDVAQTSAGKVTMLKSALSGLAAIGIVTVGIDIFIRGMSEFAKAKGEIEKLQGIQKDPSAQFKGKTKAEVETAQAEARESLPGLKAELAESQRLKPVDITRGFAGPLAKILTGKSQQTASLEAPILRNKIKALERTLTVDASKFAVKEKETGFDPLNPDGTGGTGGTKSTLDNRTKQAQQLESSIRRRLNLAEAEKGLARFIAEQANKRSVLEDKITKIKEGGSSKEIDRATAEARNLQIQEQAAKLKERVAELSEKALKPLQAAVQAVKEQARVDERIEELIREGINPQRAEDIANLEKIKKKTIERLNVEIEVLTAIVNQGGATQAQIDALDALIKKRKEAEDVDPPEVTSGGNYDNAKSEFDQFKDAFEDGLNDMMNIGPKLAGVAVGAIGTMTDGLIELITTGKADFKAMAASILKDIAKIMLQAAIAGAVKKMFGLADGGVIQAGRIQPYAKGGVVAGPTVFPMAGNNVGLMGEAGPEAIMPLKRGPGGRLGVEVANQNNPREAMSRYSRGSRGGGVIPSDGGSSASADGGVAVAAPIDVRYSVERINSVDYVTADQFQSGMQRAASQGAQRGEQNTLKRLQMSGSTRKRIGL